MKLERVDISEDAKTAVCQWDVENMDQLMQAVQQFKISWKIAPSLLKRYTNISYGKEISILFSFQFY